MYMYNVNLSCTGDAHKQLAKNHIHMQTQLYNKVTEIKVHTGRPQCNTCFGNCSLVRALNVVAFTKDLSALTENTPNTTHKMKNMSHK